MEDQKTVNTSEEQQAQNVVEEHVSNYIKVRERLEEIKRKFDEERAPWVEMQNLLSARLMQIFDEAGAMSVKTKAGTAYASSKTTASLADADAFMRFVTEQKRFDLLDRKANATACREYVEQHNTLPPGVNLSTIRTIGVRRPGSKSE